MPVPAGPTKHKFSVARTHSRLERYSKVAGFTEDLERSNSERTFVTGKAAALRRFCTLAASREAISASTRVRRNSSGDQRWVLADTKSSGDNLRMAERRSRRSPDSRSAGRAGAGALTADLLWRRPRALASALSACRGRRPALGLPGGERPCRPR